MFQPNIVFNRTFRIEPLLAPTQLQVYHARAQALESRFKWSENLRPLWKAYLLHSSVNVPGKVAYFASVENMVNGRLTRTSPEMFLERVLSWAPDEIRAAWAMEVLGQVLPTIQFISNTDPDGWVKVYHDGPHSCMADSDLVRQYAHPNNNLALAYIRQDDKRVTYRAIVNQQRKTYLRAYGDPADMPFFIASLKTLGYKQSGATLQDETIRLKWGECQGCGATLMVGPYLDGDYDNVNRTGDEEGIIGDRGNVPHHIEDDLYCCGDYCDNHRSDDEDDNYDDGED